MERSRRRHCWECRRRCLVCDSTEPACKRCSKSGLECPGYSDVKPTKFTWLAPGMIVSRGPKRNKTLSDHEGSKLEERTSRTTRELVSRMASTHAGIPRFELTTDICALAEAAEYFNSCMYPDLAPLAELGPSPHIYRISDMHLRAASTSPNYLVFGMLCITLSHRINKTRNFHQSKLLTSRFYHYWGITVRSLNEDLSQESKRTKDVVIAGILTLLFTDVQQGTSLNWRCHLEGVHKLIAIRGGFREVARSRSSEPLLLCLWFLAVIGNTTCPATELFMPDSQLDTLEFILERFAAAVSPIHAMPLPLFAEIVRTSQLRMRAAKLGTAGDGDLEIAAYEILDRVHRFSPENWATSKTSSREDWTLIGKVHQAAVALYCILSLQSLSVLPLNPILRACCINHAQLLRLLISEGLPSRKIKRFMMWPLVLLGVEAVHGDHEMRDFVSKTLPALSQDTGTHVPLTAKKVLEVFWSSGETRWDACFDRPYAFTMHLAVDTSRLLPSS